MMKEAFLRARKAREVLPEVFGKKAAARMLKLRGQSKSGDQIDSWPANR